MLCSRSQPTSVSRDDGLRLKDAYICAGARCAPPDNKPTPAELANCRPYLETEIRLLSRVKVVLTLGLIAHQSWLDASGWRVGLPPRLRPRFAHGAERVMPDGVVLLSSYHPSRQNTNTGRLTREMWHSVFRRAREIIG